MIVLTKGEWHSIIWFLCRFFRRLRALKETLCDLRMEDLIHSTRSYSAPASIDPPTNGLRYAWLWDLFCVQSKLVAYLVFIHRHHLFVRFSPSLECDLQGDDFLLGEDGMCKQSFPNHWKGKNGLYCVGLSRRGLYGAAADAVNVANDIKQLLR